MEVKEIKALMDALLQTSGLNVRSRETGEANAGPGGLMLYEEALVGVAAAAAQSMPHAGPALPVLVRRGRPRGAGRTGLYQQLVRAAHRLRLRARQLWLIQGNHYRKGHGGPAFQRGHHSGGRAQPAALHRPLRILHPVWRLRPPLPGRGHHPGKGQGASALRRFFRPHNGAVFTEIRLWQMSDRSAL